jgi:TPR repeat protein
MDYAKLLADGTMVPYDPIQARYYFRMAAKRGDLSSQLEYAKRLASGNGIDQDLDEAQCFFSIAANHPDRVKFKESCGSRWESSSLPLCNYLNKMWEYAEWLSERSNQRHLPAAAQEIFEMVADDDIHGEYRVLYADRLSRGDGVERDLVKAQKYYKMAGDLSSSHRLNYLIRLIKGDGVKANPDEAQALWVESMSVKYPDPIALWEYAERLVKGNGIAKNLDEASRCFERAASRSADHRWRYGERLASGDGVNINLSQAQSKFEEVMRRQSSPSHAWRYVLRLGKGEGVRQDLAKAAHYFERAKDSDLYWPYLLASNGPCMVDLI